MKIGSAFPSTFLKAADLQGRAVNCIIQEVRTEDIGDGHKPVMYFEGKEKGLVLNKTNALTLSEAYGEETDDWCGQPVEVFPDKTMYEGRRVDCIRVRVARAAAPARPPQARQPAPPREAPAATSEDQYGSNIGPSDDIPFMPCR